MWVLDLNAGCHLSRGLALNDHLQVNGANTSLSAARIKEMIYLKHEVSAGCHGAMREGAPTKHQVPYKYKAILHNSTYCIVL